MQTNKRLGDGLATAVVGDVLIAVWQSPATVERWQWLKAQVDALLTRSPGGFVCFYIILSSSTPPNAALRTKMQAHFRRLGPELRRLVVVPLGDSLWKSVVRTLVRAIMLVSGRAKQQAVAASIDEGIDRVLDVAGPNTPTRAELRAGAEALLRMLGAQELVAAHHP
ncbi:MAG TPA: hypothetical protein VFS00_13480 [Polyangiaceae bacterium]|nr:hypothetical protein [Polyangiaceae bacterium]